MACNGNGKVQVKSAEERERERKKRISRKKKVNFSHFFLRLSFENIKQFFDIKYSFIFEEKKRKKNSIFYDKKTNIRNI